MPRSSILFISILFFISGIPALLYQLVWQRALFTIFGVNIESITVVVSAFMLGLGIGSIIGGRLSSYNKLSPLLAFAIIEIGIAIFGYYSLSLFDFIAVHVSGVATFYTFIISFLLVLFPTLLMGATLPILVNYFVKTFGNVGKSLGLLYFVNTIGSAVACILAGLWIFNSFGLSGTVSIAISINVLVALSITGFYFVVRNRTYQVRAANNNSSTTVIGNKIILDKPLIAACIIACTIGFISLSFEILWARVYGFASGAASISFAFMLGFFLLGIAFGSLYAGRLIQYLGERGDKESLKKIGYFLFIANIVSFMVIPVLSWVVSDFSWITNSDFRWVFSLPMVAISAGLLGAAMPILGHYAIPADAYSGQKVSYLYLSNIIGATCGSLITGFVVLDYFTSIQTSLIITLLGCLVAVTLVMASSVGNRYKSIGYGAFSFGIVLVLYFSVFEKTFEQLQFNLPKKEVKTFATILENKHGIITVTSGGVVYGGGVYDGSFNIDPIKNTNEIVRAYLFSATHKNPKDVLMIGLSTGSWAQVVANHPAVEKLTIVEINPGYVELIKNRPVMKSLLENPKVNIIIDDGRRWLNSNPDSKFDFIISNTTFNYSSYASNLLSISHLKNIKKHLNIGGRYYFNTTGSKRAIKTSFEVFDYGYSFSNMMMLANEPFFVERESFVNELKHYRINNRLMFDPSIVDVEFEISKVANNFFKSEKNISASAKNAPFSGINRTNSMKVYGHLASITDDNMGHEWNRGHEALEKYLDKVF